MNHREPLVARGVRFVQDRGGLIAGVLFTLASLAAVFAITYMGRHLTFWQDAWGFIQGRLSWDLDAFMVPHNEHWALGIAVLWKPLLGTIGMAEYWPYLLVLAVFHVLTAAAVFRYFLRGVNALTALAAALCVLFLGSAGEDLFWAFQVGFVGATAAGAWALVLFLQDNDRPRRLLASALLLIVAVTMSGPGLFFLVAIGSVVILSPPRRKHFWVLVPAVAAYATWALTYGRSAVRIDYIVALQNLDAVVAFVRVGVETAIGNLSGAGAGVGLVIGVVLIGALLWHLLAGGPLVDGAVAGTVGLLSQFALTGLTRAFHLGAESAGSSRYGYSAAIFVLIALGAWLAARRRSPGLGIAFVVAVAGIAALSIATNAPDLRGWRDWFWDRAFETRAAVSIMERYGGSPAIPADRYRATSSIPTLAGLPGVSGTRAIADSVGLDLADYGDPSPPIPDRIYDYVLFGLVRESLVIGTEHGMPAISDSIDTSGSEGVAITELGNGCLAMEPTRTDGQVSFSAPGGAVLHVDLPLGGTSRLYLSLRDSYDEESSLEFGSIGPDVTLISLPDLGADTPWFARLTPLPMGVTSLCMTTPVR